MGKAPGKYRKWCRIFCALLLIGSLLLAGCASKPNEQGQTQPPETTKAAEVTDATQGTQTDGTEPTADTSADSSLASLRQAMAETPQLFAAAFFGYAAQDADPFDVMQEAAPQLCEDLPFLLAFDQEHILGAEGQLFCIVPADENATLAVNRRPWNAETASYEEPEVLYRSENGAPILVMCPNEDWIPDTEIVITDSKGAVTVWSPYLDPSYRVSALRNENGESLIFDFTSYDELSGPGMNQKIDSAELVGTWALAWTEVEGDRNEATPGVCTVEIALDKTDAIRFTYVNKDFPEENIQDRELLVIPGELYPGCSNDQWIGEVTEARGDAATYALTLLEDGTLLLQTYWETDGMLWISYGWYERID